MPFISARELADLSISSESHYQEMVWSETKRRFVAAHSAGLDVYIVKNFPLHLHLSPKQVKCLRGGIAERWQDDADVIFWADVRQNPYLRFVGAHEWIHTFLARGEWFARLNDRVISAFVPRKKKLKAWLLEAILSLKQRCVRFYSVSEVRHIETAGDLIRRSLGFRRCSTEAATVFAHYRLCENSYIGKM